LPAKPYRIVQLGAGSGAEVWAPKRLDPIAIGAALRRLGGVWFAVGAEYEADLATAAGIPDEHNLCGRTTWDQLAHLLAGAECYIGNDSGPTHLAAALKIPTLALFGFTSPILNAPIGPTVLVIQADMPCAFKGCPIPCPERTCIATMTAEAIEAGMNLLLAERGSTEWWRAAAGLRIAGLRPFLPGVPVEDPDPLAGALADESTIGAPRDPAAALLREWLATSER
jgi:ADP-heptose:LPS heptosyltransferase